MHQMNTKNGAPAPLVSLREGFGMSEGMDHRLVFRKWLSGKRSILVVHAREVPRDLRETMLEMFDMY